MSDQMVGDVAHVALTTFVFLLLLFCVFDDRGRQ